MSLNPNSPTLAGCEWFPFRQRGCFLSKDTPLAAVLTPGALLTDDISVAFRSPVGSPLVQAAIVKVSDLTPASAVTTVTTYRPSGDGSFAGAAHAGGGTGSPFYVDVDEVVLDPTDYIINQATTNQSWSLLFAAGAFGAGLRVLNVSYKFYAAGANGFGVPTTVLPWFQAGASKAYGTLTAGTQVGGTTPGLYEAKYAVNPVTGLAWTQADIVALASTSLMGFDLFAPAVNTFKMFQAWIEVTTVPETRLATGSAFVTATGRKQIAMATPAGSSTWTPVAATPYAVIFTVLNDGQLSIAALDAGVAHPDIYVAPVTVSADGFPYALGTHDTAAPSVMGLNAATRPVWGQPYESLVDELVNVGRTVQMEVTLPDTQDRGWLKFVARQETTNTIAPLVARLKRRSDNVQIGGDVTVATFIVRDEPSFAQQIALPMASAGTGTVAQYYVEFTSAALAGAGWVLSAMSTDEGPATETLSAAAQSFEDGSTGGYGSNGTTAASLANSTTQAFVGTHSLLASNLTGTPGNQRIFVGGTGNNVLAVTPGVTCTGTAHVRAAVNARTVRLRYRFYTAALALIATTYPGADVVETTTGWQTATVSAVAPATAAWVELDWEIDAAGAGGGEGHYIDGVSNTMGGYLNSIGLNSGQDLGTFAGVESLNTIVPVLVGKAVTSPAGLTVVAA